MPREQMLKSLTESLWAIQAEAHAAIMSAAIAGDRYSGASDEQPAVEARRGGQVQTSGTVAVIPISGVIRPRPSIFEVIFGVGGASITGIRAMLRESLSDSQIGSIVLNIDSPGGFVDGVPELAEEIRKARSKKPIVAVSNTTAASAAYWLAAQASELYVTPSGSVGSIGVFIAHEDWSKFDERIGVKTTLISAGKYKTEGNPYEPLSDEARAAYQERVDEYYGMFVGAVAKGRKVSESAVRGGYGEGRMVLARGAKTAGMVDEVGTLEDAVRRAAELAMSGGGTGRAAQFDADSITAEQLAEAAERHGLDLVARVPDGNDVAGAGLALEDIDLSKPYHRELVKSRLRSSDPGTSDT